MGPPQNLAIVRTIVALSLLSGGDACKGVLFSAAQIAVFVNFVLVVVGGEELVLTEDHIKKSFANRGGDVDYELSISAICGDKFAEASDLLCARTSFREDGKSSARTTAIGIFSSLDDAVSTRIVQKKSAREFEAAVGDILLVTAEQKEKARKAVVGRQTEAARKKRKAKEVEQRAKTDGGRDGDETAGEQPPETITPPSQSPLSSPGEETREEADTVTADGGGGGGGRDGGGGGGDGDDEQLPDTAAEVEDEEHFVYEYRGRVMYLRKDDIPLEMALLLESGTLLPIPDQGRATDDPSVKRQKKNQVKHYGQRLGQRLYALPNAFVGVVKSHFNKISELSMNVGKGMARLFLRTDNRFNGTRDFRRHIAMTKVMSPGASDDTICHGILFNMSAVCGDLNLGVDDWIIAKSAPSRRSISRCLLDFAGEIVAVEVSCIKEAAAAHPDKKAYLFASFDHANKKGCDHFVQLVSRWNDKTNRVVSFCHDTHEAGHSAKAAVEAMCHSFKKFDGIPFECLGCTGDSGGGAKVQNVVAELALEEADEFQNVVDIGCALHQLNLVFSVPAELSFGKGGIGNRTAMQLVAVASYMIGRLKTEQRKRYWYLAMKELERRSDWKEEAYDQFPVIFGEFLDDIKEQAESEDADAADDVAWNLCDPGKIATPVWSRWEWVSKAIDKVVENWIPLYFLFVAIKQHNKTNNYLHKLSAIAISLMREQPSEEDVMEYINSLDLEEDDDQDDDEVGDEEANEDEDGDAKFDPAAVPPTLYVHLLFLRAYSDYFFLPHMNLLKKTWDAAGDFGYRSPLMAAHTFVMWKELTGLKEGGWKTRPLFKKFNEHLNRMIGYNGNVTKGGRESVEKAVGVFFTKAIELFNKHFAATWQRQEICHYALAGEPVIAWHLARWMTHSGPGSYSFPNDMVELPTLKHSEDPSIVNLRELMAFITTNSDPRTMINGSFTSDFIDDIFQLAESPAPVNLYDESKASWGDNDYTNLKSGCQHRIIPHQHHNQRAENYVQRIANASRTKAGPMVRNAIVLVKSAIVTPIDKALLEKKRSTIDDPVKRRKAKVEGTERNTPILQRFKAVSKEADALRASDPELFHRVRELVNNPANSLAKVVADRDAAEFELNMQQPRSLCAEERRTGTDITSAVGGAVPLGDITAKKGCYPHVVAECLARNLTEYQCPKNGLQVFANMKSSFSVRKKAIALDEYGRRAQRSADQGPSNLELKDIRDIVPLSAKMKELLPNYVPDEDDGGDDFEEADVIFEEDGDDDEAIV